MVDYPTEEQGIPEKREEGSLSTEDEQKEEMDEGKRDEEVYSAEGREQLVEDGEMQPYEQGFMEGASGKGQTGLCTKCGAVIGEEHSDVCEKEVNGEKCVFCCAACRDTYDA